MRAELGPVQVVEAARHDGNCIVANPTARTLTLFGERRWVEFVDALLPDAPPEFRQECVRILTEDVEKTSDDETRDGEAASDEI